MSSHMQKISTHLDTHLVTALANLKMNNFTHFGRRGDLDLLMIWSRRLCSNEYDGPLHLRMRIVLTGKATMLTTFYHMHRFDV